MNKIKRSAVQYLPAGADKYTCKPPTTIFIYETTSWVAS